jgi:hypothetical protein
MAIANDFWATRSSRLAEFGGLPILASDLPLSENRQEFWETIVTSEQAREKCHQHLIAGLRLIQPEERVIAIAAALQDVEAQEK